MRACYFGSYNPNYSRNRVIIKGLRKNGVDVLECNDYFSRVYMPPLFPLRSLNRAIRLIKKHRGLDYDVMVVGYLGQPLIRLAKMITRKPIVFDAYLSLYEMEVVDRRQVSSNSYKAVRLYYYDKFSCELADIVLLDTNQHINYFCERFGLERNKFRRIFVGSDDEVFYPRQLKRDNSNFLVMFWGSFIPLQGVKYIVMAAKLLENYKDIKFEIIGSGQTYDEVRRLAERLKISNISFFPEWIPYDELPNYVARADVCLGIFGDTEKAKRVIPNKAYESLAMRKPLITGDSPAAREVLKDEKNCVLCEMADPQAIRRSILMLKEDEKLRKKIAENGYDLFKMRFSPEVIGKELKTFIMKLMYK